MYNKPGGDSKFLKLALPGDRTQMVHYKCKGKATQQGMPVMIFDAGNWAMDIFYGIARLANKTNCKWIVQYNCWLFHFSALGDKHRYCMFDIPGTGLSDYLFEYQTGPDDYYEAMMQAFEEEEKGFGPPYAMIGYMEGATTSYNFALNNPDKVSSVVLVEAMRPEFWWRRDKAGYGWSEQEAEEKRKEYANGMKVGMNLINALAVPTGLMNIYAHVKPWNASEEHWNDDDAL